MEAAIIGKIIKRFREERQFSQEVLSGLADVDRSHLSKIELGLRSPTIHVLYKIANALGVNASEILKAVELETIKCTINRQV
ncbi:MAG: helix-turn-helix domain-containing protein [Oscillospiraceae bacterium]|nr:helix-turn-helix domain-containing protein [Oscillospiraceae bacterium]